LNLIELRYCFLLGGAAILVGNFGKANLAPQVVQTGEKEQNMDKQTLHTNPISIIFL